MPLEAKYQPVDALFRAFTATPRDPKTFIFDVRDRKEFAKGHVALSYCLRVAASTGALLDYSQNRYAVPWSPDAYWGKPVIVYGPEGLSRDHPVVKALETEGRAASISVFREGLSAFAARYPSLVTQGVGQGGAKSYPSQILPGLLYLGDWDQVRAGHNTYMHERIFDLRHPPYLDIPLARLLP
jgi:dual specificity MAP kinase phosphatase